MTVFDIGGNEARFSGFCFNTDSTKVLYNVLIVFYSWLIIKSIEDLFCLQIKHTYCFGLNFYAFKLTRKNKILKLI